MLAANPTSHPFTLSFEGAPLSKSVPVSNFCVSVFTSPNLSSSSSNSSIRGFVSSVDAPDGASSISPLSATLTTHLQLTENKTTLSLLFATLTRRVKANPFVCHSYKKHRGWGIPCAAGNPARDFLTRSVATMPLSDHCVFTSLRLSLRSTEATQRPPAKNAKIPPGGDSVSTEAVAARRHAGTHLPVTWWKLEMPTTTWHLLLN